jgi:hypothetical protein
MSLKYALVYPGGSVQLSVAAFPGSGQFALKLVGGGGTVKVTMLLVAEPNALVHVTLYSAVVVSCGVVYVEPGKYELTSTLSL